MRSRYQLSDMVVFLFCFFPSLHKQAVLENKVHECCLKLESWQGPPHTNKLKQHEIVLSFKFSLFIQFIQS